MNRRRLNPRLRIQFLGLLMLLGCGALGMRLWWVQVARGADWTARIRGSSEATVRIPSVRGEIKDRNGMTLVGNRASYEVDFYLPEMVKGMLTCLVIAFIVNPPDALKPVAVFSIFFD